MLFEFLKDIVYRKGGDLLNNPGNLNEFQPFMIHRWLSFHSPEMVKLLNNTTNKLYSVFESKKEWYNILLTTLPKTNIKKFKYIKKVAVKEKSEYDLIIEFIAKNKQISQREVLYYIKEFNLDISKYKKIIKES